MTGPTSINQEAVFIGANRQGFVADTIPDLVAYGAGCNVALWNPLSADKKGVYHTLSHHTKEVTCVRFVPDSDLLISAGEDGTINIWKQYHENGQIKYKLHQSIHQEDCSITCMAVSDQIVVTGNSLGNIHIWQLINGSFESVHDFKVKFNFYPTTFALQKIHQRYLLAVGGTSNNIFIYSFDVNAINFSECASLAGHEDWIKCLSFVTEKDGLDYILASGSQDRYIRLWRLRLNEAIDDSDEDDLKLILLSNKQYKFAFGEGRAAFSSEALIMGHDDWVTGLQWNPSYTRKDSKASKKLQLLSLSADTALMIWEMDEESGIWISVSRLGELSIKGASTATGASGGFWSCLWFEDSTSGTQYILANGKTGSIRVYHSVEGAENTWEASLGVTGPVREVNDLVWSADGSYFMLTSLDQTTRLYAPWKINRDTETITWHEFARPQIHGYDMICLDIISPTKFVSGGDEKVLRVFEMTQSISAMLSKFCGIDLAAEDNSVLPEAASLPVLGLSNKAANEQLEAGEAQQREEDYEGNLEEGANEKTDLLASLDGPPLEDYLQRHTLFPEIEKLYGHGYEITCCTTSPNGKLIASACRSNSSKHAVIRIFNVEKEYQLVSEVLKGHNLTITSLEFSPDGKYLVAVSRDRQLSLWKIKNEAEGTFNLVELNPKAHTRIVWDCSWGPEFQGESFFVTGSRDKSIKLWHVTDSGVNAVSTIKTEEAVTSITCFQQQIINNLLIVATGHENGQISLYSVNMSDESKKFEKVVTFDKEISPSGRVGKLAFSKKLQGGKLLLATGSSDNSVRLYSVSKEALI